MDHEQRLSFAVIFGSFRGRGGKELDQHYVSLSYLHEPKGGILPLEVEEDPSGEEATDLQNTDGGDEGGGGTGWAGGKSPQARSSEIAKRFSRWIREQRLAVLRGFSAEEAEDEIEQRGEGEEKQKDTSTDDALAPSGGAYRDEDGGVEAAEEGDLRETPGNGNEERVAAGGPGGESSATGRRVAEEKGVLDPSTQETDEEAEQAGPMNDVEEYGPTIGGEQDSADAGGNREEAENGRREGEEGRRDVGRDVETMDTVREPPLSASVTEATVRGVGLGESGGDGIAVDVSDTRTTAGDGEEGTRSRTEEDARKGFVVRQSSPSQQQTPLQQPPEDSTDPSMRDFAEQEESDERTHTFHAFPPADTVTISCRGEPVDSVPNPRADASFTWEADGIG